MKEDLLITVAITASMVLVWAAILTSVPWFWALFRLP
jgi:hypothetical protein